MAPRRTRRKMTDNIISLRCPNPWMKLRRSQLIPPKFVTSWLYSLGILGRSWTCSYRPIPLMSRRSLPGDDTNLRRLLGYSLAPGSRLRNHPEMRVAHRWRKPLESSSFQDHLWLQTNLPWQKCLKTRQLRLLLRLHRRRGETRSGGCARSCEMLATLRLTRATALVFYPYPGGRDHLLPFLLHMSFFYRQSIFNMHSPLTHLSIPTPMIHLIIFLSSPYSSLSSVRGPHSRGLSSSPRRAP